MREKNATKRMKTNFINLWWKRRMQKKMPYY